jgi:hypothetical protein
MKKFLVLSVFVFGMILFNSCTETALTDDAGNDQIELIDKEEVEEPNDRDD